MRAKELPQLHTLDLGDKHLGDVRAKELVPWRLPMLQSLDFTRNGIGEAGAGALATWSLPQLR